MIDSSVARRYARALLALASTGDGATGARDADASAERIDAQLKALAAALDHSPEARNESANCIDNSNA